MKINYDNGCHCFYWGKNGFWIVEEEDIKKFRQMINDWIAEGDNAIDYNFCYTEILDWFQLIDWKKIPEKKQKKIIKYLIRQV